MKNKVELFGNEAQKVMIADSNTLRLKRLGIDTQKEFVVYMRSDCHICISEGFEAMTRLEATVKGKTIIATLNVLHGELLQPGEAGLSESAWKALEAREGEIIAFSHLQPVGSMSYVRAKVYGNKLDDNAFQAIVSDVVKGKYSNIELAAFITACAGDNLDAIEIADLTKAMVGVGQKLVWEQKIVVDKHCVGGVPGNRTTPIVVSIAAAAGLTIPKTSSRAITSPVGTVDVTEIDNRRLAKVVKLSGAPSRPGAGVLMHCKMGQILKAGDPMFTLFAETPGELDYAKMYLERELEHIIKLKYPS